MYRSPISWIILLAISMVSPAHAKLFKFNDAKVAAYAGGAWGPAFENTLNSKSNSDAVTSVTLNSEHSYNLAGEFGFVFGSKQAHLGFGLEVLKPKDITEEMGKSSGGGELYSLTSEISVIIPKLRLEIAIKNWPRSRIFIGGEAGWAYLIARNSYAFTPAGSTAYGGLADFYEDLRGSAPMYGGFIGFEKVLSDTTTFSISGGYRGLHFTEVNHNRDVTTFQGSVSKGDLARNINGETRTLDLSGFMTGANLRFWFR